MSLLLSKLKALSGHLLVSVFVLFSVFGVVWWVWYPGFLFELNAVQEGSLLVVFVDLVLGPLLTFLVYKPKKKGLVFDFLVIGLLQIAALGYGVGVLYSCRPLALVVMNGIYYSVSADVFANYKQTYESDASEKSTRLCGFPCYLIEPSEAANTSAIAAGVSARVKQEFYIDYESNWKRFESTMKGVDVDRLSETKRRSIERTFRVLASQGGLQERDVLWVEARGRNSTGFLCVLRANGRILGFVNGS